MSTAAKKVIIAKWCELDKLILYRKNMVFNKSDIDDVVKKGFFTGQALDSKFDNEFKGPALIIFEAFVPTWATNYISSIDVKLARIIYSSSHKNDLVDEFQELANNFVTIYVQRSRQICMDYLVESKPWALGDDVPLLQKHGYSDYELQQIHSYKPNDFMRIHEICKINYKTKFMDYLKLLTMKVLAQCEEVKQDKEICKTESSPVTTEQTTNGQDNALLI